MPGQRRKKQQHFAETMANLQELRAVALIEAELDMIKSYCRLTRMAQFHTGENSKQVEYWGKPKSINTWVQVSKLVLEADNGLAAWLKFRLKPKKAGGEDESDEATEPPEETELEKEVWARMQAKEKEETDGGVHGDQAAGSVGAGGGDRGPD